MEKFDQFVSLLDQADDEVWGNVWIDDAAKLFQEQHALFIPVILAQWRGWSVNRQEHLAVLLGSTGLPDEKNLIEDMLSATDLRVRNRASEALDEFQHRK